MPAEMIQLRDVAEFRQTLAARPPAIVHGTALLLALLLGGTVAWASYTAANVVVHGAARVRPADAPLRGFELASTEQVHAEANGRIVALDVREGERVAAGTVLVRLDTARIDNDIAQLTSVLEAGRAELAAIRDMTTLVGTQFEAAKKRGEAEIHRSQRSVSRSRRRMVSDQRLAHVELGEAAKELERARDLVAQQAGPAADVATASARVERVRERLAAARIGVDDGEPEVLRRSLEQAARDREVKRADLARQGAAKQGEIAALEARLANLELERGHATLRAHRAGIVTLGGLAVGDVLAAGKLPLAIVDDGRLRVDAAIGAADVASVRLGMRVRIKVTALDFQRYGVAEGTITHVAADTSSANGASYYLISVALDRDELVRGDARGRLKAGMTGDLEVITERAALITLFLRSIRGAISL